ncbi:MAG TPA: hypothetical protein VF533_05900 [Solirubrobacteraceae bacterium]|jgi:hypothetical protein
MAGPRRFDVEDILIRPGTYYNPETEVLLVVDDTTQLDTEVANAGDEEGEGDWILVSNEMPVDEHSRDELLEAFTARFHPGTSGAVAGDEDDPGEVDPELEADEEE